MAGDGRSFDDFEVGQRFTSRGVTLTEAEIIAFALAHDPQPFHVDKVAAAESPYGGLIASGFHTLVAGFRMVVQENIFTAASMGSPGMDEVRWLKPVYPGDTLTTELEVLDKQPSRSRPDRGRLRIAYTIRNQDGEAVTTFTTTQILARRAGEGG